MSDSYLSSARADLAYQLRNLNQVLIMLTMWPWTSFQIFNDYFFRKKKKKKILVLQSSCKQSEGFRLITRLFIGIKYIFIHKHMNMVNIY